jgi:tRNA threonylcarbamoyl adenosine modification protein YeaZ
VLVDCGPGSFTGLRVGLATAHGLAIGWSVPLSGCSSMALIAAAADEPELAVALAAGHGELFVQSWAHDPLRPTDELRSLRPEEAAAVIGCEAVYGSGAQSLVDSRGHGRAVEALPRAAAARLLPKGLRTFPAVPIYGRAPDARLPG